ncbi:hypothetical protein BDZ91DRAFT_848985 [Kalaharituber pfeilii]|nr:hypothetical protein BDZ91DRAFT_848985 [Kalaharituber pfeilii]
MCWNDADLSPHSNTGMQVWLGAGEWLSRRDAKWGVRVMNVPSEKTLREKDSDDIGKEQSEFSFVFRNQGDNGYPRQILLCVLQQLTIPRKGMTKEWDVKIGKAAEGAGCRCGKRQTADHLAFRCEEVDYPKGWAEWRDFERRKWVERQENGEEVDILEQLFRSLRA